MPGSHEIQNVTEPHLFAACCPFLGDVLAQGLKGEDDYPGGMTIGQSCFHLRQPYPSRNIHKNPEWSRTLPMPGHVQSPRAVPYAGGGKRDPCQEAGRSGREEMRALT